MSLTPRLHDDGQSRLVAYDHGAHLASWELAGDPVLWLSERAVLDGSASIRGGVPICFPWFADGPDGDHSPSHGVVRTVTWHVTPAQDDELWAWELSDADVAGAPGSDLVPGPFRLRYAVRLTRDGEDRSPTLNLALVIHNTGAEAYLVEAALHTYLAVRDVRQVQIQGLAGAEYLDKVTGRRALQDGALVLTEETDRVYDRSGPVVVEDRAGGRLLEVTPTGATQTVVWNPWRQQAADLPDVDDGGWRRFVCVETAATADRALAVAPGATVALGCSITTRPVSPT